MYQIVRVSDGWQLRASWVPVELQMHSYRRRLAAILDMRAAINIRRQTDAAEIMASFMEGLDSVE